MPDVNFEFLFIPLILPWLGCLFIVDIISHTRAVYIKLFELNQSSFIISGAGRRFRHKADTQTNLFIVLYQITTHNVLKIRLFPDKGFSEQLNFLLPGA